MAVSQYTAFVQKNNNNQPKHLAFHWIQNSSNSEWYRWSDGYRMFTPPSILWLLKYQPYIGGGFCAMGNFPSLDKDANIFYIETNEIIFWGVKDLKNEQELVYEMRQFLNFTPSIRFSSDFTKSRSFGLLLFLRRDNRLFRPAKYRFFTGDDAYFLPRLKTGLKNAKIQLLDMGTRRNYGPKYCYTVTLENPKSVVIGIPRH